MYIAYVPATIDVRLSSERLADPAAVTWIESVPVVMSVAAADYLMGSSQVFVNLPPVLQGQFDVFGVGVGRYRLMIIVICSLLTLALQMS